MALFPDRHSAAAELARLLIHLKDEKPIVLGLANGGVPMAEVIAKTLEAPLDVLIIRRLRAPKNPEHIVGALDEHGRISMIRSTARWHHLTSKEMVHPAREKFRELQRQRGLIRAKLPEIEVRDRTVIIVGQGVASGAKMLGAISSVRDRGARKVVVAAPAGSGEAAWQLHETADLVVIPHRPARKKAVRDFYDELSDVTDQHVLAIVERWVASRPQEQGVRTILMKFAADTGTLLCAEVDLPPGTTRGSGPFPVVVFVHGYESSGRNPRTVPVSRRLAKRGVIGARLDLTGHGRSEGALEDATAERMAADLAATLAQLRQLDEVDESRIGLVGSGSGGPLVLAVARRTPEVRALVVRGPICGTEIEDARTVDAATLLIYAAADPGVTDAARATARALPSTHQVLEIPDSTRLFGDAISHEMMVGASVDWLVDHLAPIPVEEGSDTAADEISSPSPTRGPGMVVGSGVENESQQE